MKHTLKLFLRDAFSRTLYHTGLARLVSALMPPRLTILAGHCVADESVNGELPADMKISAARLEAILRALGRRARLVTIAEGLEALERGEGPSLVALSMDDGYKDNRTALLPLLERVGGRATVFLESRPLTERALSWSHKYFWLLARMDAAALARAYLAEAQESGVSERLRRVLAEDAGGDLAYRVKRVFKYEAPAAERDGVLDRLFRAHGGDERALCERIYMSWDDVRALAAAGVELGGHTVRHEVLSTLVPEEVREEILRGREEIVGELGELAGRTFAYPFGRRWDFGPEAREAVREAGFRAAVTTHAGTNEAGAERTTLARWMIDESTPIHLLATEASGGFALLRRLGLELAE